MAETRLGSRWRILDISIMVTGLTMVIYQMSAVHILLLGPIQHQATHLGFALALVFLLRFRKTQKTLMLALAFLSLVPTVYVIVLYYDLEMRSLANTPIDLVIGVVLILVCLIATKVEFGWVLPILAITFALYAFLGFYIPSGPFHTFPISWGYLISKLSVALTGIFSVLLSVSANFIFLFMVFASLMLATGAVEFFVQVGKLISSRFRAGAALAAVLTSSLVGSISGQAGANVTITGSFTIPVMKKLGYSPEQAAAIEAAASSGGPIIPPVMGVAAFIMCGLTGIAYGKIILVAIIPALFYIFSCALYVIFQSRKLKILPLIEKPNYKELLLRLPLFVIPFIVIVFLFQNGHSPQYVGFWACISVLLTSLFRKETRPSLKGLVNGLLKGAELGSRIAVSCATLGIMVTTIVFTGLGTKFPSIAVAFCGENLLLLLLLAAVASIILGTGLPAASSYVLVAVTIVPALLRIGVPLLPAHFFVFYFCNFSYITPPVALAALFAAPIAGANYIKTGIEASKIGIAGFLLAFAIVWVGALGFDFSAPVTTIIMQYVAIIIMIIAAQVSIVGFCLAECNIIERTFCAIAVATFFYFLYSPAIIVFATGVIISIGVTLWQWKKSKRTISKSEGAA